MISTPKGKYKIKNQICCQELLKKMDIFNSIYRVIE